MRILVIATSSRGGAGNAALRSFNALKNSGADIAFLSLEHQIGFTPQRVNSAMFQLLVAIRRAITLIQGLLIQKSDKLYTGLSFNFISLAYKNLFSEFDVIHFHSTYNFAGTVTYRKLINSGKSIVFTMHDERLSTGGCHYSGQCRNLTRGCHDCPLVNSSMRLIPTLVLRDSIKFFKMNRHIEIIAPSSWLARKAEEAPVFEGMKINAVNNPIPNQYFNYSAEKSSEKNQIKRIGFIAQDLWNPYKGFPLLLAALNQLQPDIKNSYELVIATSTNKVEIPSSILSEVVHPKNDEETADFYTGLDLLVVPSLEDNSPSVIGEALATGTAVLGSNTGGIPELLNEFNQSQFVANNSKSLSDVLSVLIMGEPPKVNAAAVRLKLSEERYAEKITEIYRRVVASPSK
jgi:glycosyltransferase involved in cell wall biosynthesis